MYGSVPLEQPLQLRLAHFALFVLMLVLRNVDMNFYREAVAWLAIVAVAGIPLGYWYVRLRDSDSPTTQIG